MTTRLACFAFLIAGGLAVQCKADYLFTYQDSSGNIIGFTEATLQPSGTVTSFLFDQNGVTNFAFNGIAPGSCEGLGALANGCTGLADSTGLAYSIFADDVFTAPGVYSGTNGGTVDITQYSGYLFTYQDSQGNILAFSEPTLQISGSTSQFLFSTAGVTSFSFSGNTNSCGAIGSLNPIGCTQVNNTFADDTIFAGGAFSTVGTFTSSGTTVNIVAAVDPPVSTPEPSTAMAFPLAATLGALVFGRRRRSARRS
jgi:hypothetical protein